MQLVLDASDPEYDARLEGHALAPIVVSPRQQLVTGRPYPCIVEGAPSPTTLSPRTLYPLRPTQPAQWSRPKRRASAVGKQDVLLRESARSRGVRT